jgi:hypothetical protein
LELIDVTLGTGSETEITHFEMNLNLAQLK